MMAADGDEDAARYGMLRVGLAVFFAVNVMMFSMILWAVPAAGELSAREQSFYDVLRYVALLMSLPVYGLLAPAFLQEAWSGGRLGRAWVDGLIALGVFASLGVSLHAVFTGRGPLYLEVGCGVLLAVTVGRWLEATGRLQVRQAIDRLTDTLPDTVRVRQSDGSWQSGAVDGLQIGEHILVGPQERVPVDGRVVAGRAYVDERATRGESMPAARWPGCIVCSGSTVLDGTLHIEVLHTAAESTWQRLVAAVEEAMASAYRVHPTANRFAACFLPLTVALALVAGVYHAWDRSWPNGMFAALAVLVVACPCALGIATPLACWVAMERAARHGVLIRDVAAFLRLAETRVLCFDKTGTLTTGQPTGYPVWSQQALEDHRLQQLIAAALHLSSHPLACALRASVPAPDNVGQVVEHQVVPGRGVKVRLRLSGARPVTVLVGNREFLEEEQTDWTPVAAALDAERQGRSEFRVYAACHGQCHACFPLVEQVRSEAKELVRRAKELGWQMFVFSGDRPSAVERLVSALGIEGKGGLLPLDKQQRLLAVRARHGPVVMVGDGVNDIPPLLAADVSVAMGCGMDATRRVAHIALTDDDLTKLWWLFGVARQTRATIRYNLGWAFGYNSIGLALAAANVLHPAIAALAMIVSSFWVIGSSLRLSSYADVSDRRSGAVAPIGTEATVGSGWRQPDTVTGALEAM